MSRSTLTLEYRKAVEEQELDYRAIKGMAMNSIAHSFVDEPTKTRLMRELTDAFNRFEVRQRLATLKFLGAAGACALWRTGRHKPPRRPIAHTELRARPAHEWAARYNARNFATSDRQSRFLLATGYSSGFHRQSAGPRSR